jgi:hypothetical protein
MLNNVLKIDLEHVRWFTTGESSAEHEVTCYKGSKMWTKCR